MKKVVVTGGGGFIGSHSVDALLAQGVEVVVVDNFSTGRRENLAHLGSACTVHEHSIVDTAFLTDVCRGADAVLHLAALPSVPKSVALPLETHEANATGTLAVFVAARDAGVKRVVYASSSSVYGDTPTLPKVETMPTKPLSPYAVQKLTTELYGRVFYALYGLETIGLRYFNIFGPRQDPSSAYAAVIPKFIAKMKRGESPTLHGNGEQTRDFTYIKNAVAGNLAALRATRGFGEAYNIATGNRISLNELVTKINDLLGTQLMAVRGLARPGDIQDSYADIEKARQTFGYTPVVSFDEGLRQTVASFTS
jgi:nucleoside-diphosphate-sugar epimerase